MGIRRYRKAWGILHSWHEAMSLPESAAKQTRMAEATRQRNVMLWEKRKKKLLKRLTKRKDALLQKVNGEAEKLEWRMCSECGRQWPATRVFFAPSKKRRNGKVVAVYLRRACRFCPRRKSKRSRPDQRTIDTD